MQQFLYLNLVLAKFPSYLFSISVGGFVLHFFHSFPTKVVQNDLEYQILAIPYFFQSFPPQWSKMILNAKLWPFCTVFYHNGRKMRKATVHVDLIQKDDYPADSRAISPTAFLLSYLIMSYSYSIHSFCPVRVCASPYHYIIVVCYSVT